MAYNYLSERLKNDDKVRFVAAHQNGLVLRNIGSRIDEECRRVRELFEGCGVDLCVVYDRLIFNKNTILTSSPSDPLDWNELLRVLSSIVLDEYFITILPQSNTQSNREVGIPDALITNITSFHHGAMVRLLHSPQYARDLFARQDPGNIFERKKQLRQRGLSPEQYEKGQKLRAASKTLVTNYCTIFRAVCQNGRALEYAWDWFKKEPFLVMSAVNQHELAYDHAHQELKDHPGLLDRVREVVAV